MNKENRYYFIADEKGDPGLVPGASRNLIFGGFVVAESELPQVIKVWNDFKSNTCGTCKVELKSEHFFASRSKNNPIIVRSPEKRREIAMNGFECIFSINSVAPLAYCLFKDQASKALIVESSRGNPKIDADVFWIAPFGLFALFLAHKQATGQVWWDGVSGQVEQEKKNFDWQQLKHASKLGSEIRMIDDEILFLESRESEAIQIADFLCGVLWQAMKGDEIFISPFLDKYSAQKRRDGLGILILE
jgi:hypothetical protein